MSNRRAAARRREIAGQDWRVVTAATAVGVAALFVVAATLAVAVAAGVAVAVAVAGVPVAPVTAIVPKARAKVARAVAVTRRRIVAIRSLRARRRSCGLIGLVEFMH